MSTKTGCQLDAAHPINLDPQLFSSAHLFSEGSVPLCCLNLNHCSLCEFWDVPQVFPRPSHDCLDTSATGEQIPGIDTRPLSFCLWSALLAFAIASHRSVRTCDDWTQTKRGSGFVTAWRARCSELALSLHTHTPSCFLTCSADSVWIQAVSMSEWRHNRGRVSCYKHDTVWFWCGGPLGFELGSGQRHIFDYFSHWLPTAREGWWCDPNSPLVLWGDNLISRLYKDAQTHVCNSQLAWMWRAISGRKHEKSNIQIFISGLVKKDIYPPASPHAFANNTNTLKRIPNLGCSLTLARF